MDQENIIARACDEGWTPPKTEKLDPGTRVDYRGERAREPLGASNARFYHRQFLVGIKTFSLQAAYFFFGWASDF